MTWIIIISVAAGMLLGYWVIPHELVGCLDKLTTAALCVLLLGVGIELGQQKEAWERLWKVGWRVILVPVMVALGSLLGSLVVGAAIGMPVNESLAVGAGFGWYSLSGVLLAKIYSVELGALAFITNVARELMAFLLIPVTARYIGKFSAVAPGGATTMDTTLPLVSRSTDADTAVVAFINGSILSSLVPILVPLLIKL
ncbi:MAG: lysine exporter LysO family protein [Desulfotomaculum sp.]|nr:lysine exporter LysO family protein [Desulfotomaculum sp.]